MKAIFSIYLFLLAILIGIELFIGIVVAPVIFFPTSIIGENVISHFQSGQLMSEIFVRYNGFLMVISIVSLVFEMVNFNNNKNQTFNLKFSTLMLALINLTLAILFVLYFTDSILNAQQSGQEATKTVEFAQIHAASEWCMKIMVFMQITLFFLKSIPNLSIGNKNEI